ncbi:MAG: serpin family protein [Phycisphaeraceae bacterium]
MGNNIKAAMIGAMVLGMCGAGGVAWGDETTKAHLLADCSNQFGWSLYQQVAAKDGNVLISPHSLHAALAMTYLGAKDQTAKQIADAIQVSGTNITQSEMLIGPFLIDAYPALLHGTPNMAGIAAKHDKATDKNFRGFTLNSVNAIWAQRGYPFRKDYLDKVTALFGSGLHEVDFAKDTEAARKTIKINGWVEQQTNDKIKDLLAPGTVDMATAMVLTNAVYFKAKWAEPFDVRMTTDKPFTLGNGEKISVPTMRDKRFTQYFEYEGMRAVELPYAGGGVSMMIVLPVNGKSLTDVERLLANGAMKQLLDHGSSRSREVELSVPRFKFEANYDMVPPLQKLGMVDAFDPGKADFSGIDGTRNMCVALVVHKTFIDVNEKGTEAAAAVERLYPGCMPTDKPIEFRVDQPFVFVIRHEPTGTVLFVGRVTDPRPPEVK